MPVECLFDRNECLVEVKTEFHPPRPAYGPCSARPASGDVRILAWAEDGRHVLQFTTKQFEQFLQEAGQQLADLKLKL